MSFGSIIDTNIAPVVGSNTSVINSINKDNAKTSIHSVFCEYSGKSPVKNDINADLLLQAVALENAKKDFGKTLNYVQGNEKEEPHYEYTMDSKGHTITYLIQRYNIPKETFADIVEGNSGNPYNYKYYGTISIPKKIFEDSIGCTISCLQNQN